MLHLQNLCLIEIVDYESLDSFSYKDENGIDLYSKIIVKYKNAIASANVGLGVKSEGELIISGTKGYIVVPAPWWKTEYFEVRYEDPNKIDRYFVKFDEDGLRYEVAEFLNSIVNKVDNIQLKNEESVKIAEIIEKCIK